MAATLAHGRTTLTLPRSRLRPRSAVLFAGACFGGYLCCAWQLRRLGIAADGTMARTVTGWLALFSASPGIGPIVVAGAPLPLLLELPVQLLAGPSAWAGIAIGCAMAAALLCAISAGLDWLGIRGWRRAALLALCALQPCLILGAATGSSAITAAALAGWALLLAGRWLAADDAVSMFLSAVLLGLATLASYPLLLLALPVELAVLLRWRAERGRATALGIAFITPAVATILPWAFVLAMAGPQPGLVAPIPASSGFDGAGLLPAGLVAAGAAILVKTRARPAWPAAALLLGAAAAAQLASWNAGEGPAAGQQAVRGLAAGRAIDPPEREIARSLDAEHGGGKVLIDASLGYRVIYWSGSPAAFSTSEDAAILPDLVRQPRRSPRLILVSNSPRDAINSQTGGLYQRGASWAELVREWPGAAGGDSWRLYRVVPPA
jgi:hypothetical protein